MRDDAGRTRRLSLLHRHKGLTPYLLLLPGIVWLVLFFVAPLGFLGYQSLQTGTFDTGYTFDWAFSNYWDAIRDYHEQFVRSFVYAGIATILALLVSYPLVYWIAFRAGRWKNVFLILIVAPLFVTYLVRTLAWLNILADGGPVVGRASRPPHPRARWAPPRHVRRRRGGDHLQLPAVHGVAVVRVARADRRAAARGGRGPLREQAAGVPPRHAPALRAGDRGGNAAHLHPGRGRLHQRSAARDAEAVHGRQRDPVEVPRRARLPVRRGAVVHPDGADPRRADRLCARRRAPRG